MKRLLALATIAILAACGGSSDGNDTTAYTSTAEIADTLQAAGLTCEGFTLDESTDAGLEGIPNAIEGASCTDAEYDIEMSIYGSEVDLQRATGRTAFMSYCLLADGFGFDLDGSQWTIGANFVVSVSDPDGKFRDAAPYAKALGGTVKTIDCP